MMRLAANFNPDPLIHHDLRALPIQDWRLEPLGVAKASVQGFAGSTPQVATSVPRRGHIALENTDTLFTVGNVKQFGKWLWVWLK
jgi:amino acid transporter